MPKTAYEGNERSSTQRSSAGSRSTILSASAVDVDGEKVKEFYRSIPDYNDINHLPEEEFYSTLKSLRDQKKIMLRHAVTHVNDVNGNSTIMEREFRPMYEKENVRISNTKENYNYIEKRKLDEKCIYNVTGQTIEVPNDIMKTSNSQTKSSVRREKRKTVRKTSSEGRSSMNKTLSCLQPSDEKLKSLPVTDIKSNRQDFKPKRNHSSCSISWDDQNKFSKNEIDRKFESFFNENNYFDDDNKMRNKETSRSMPSSPLRVKRSLSPVLRKRKSITIPKPFKMTQRDEEERILNELRGLRKCFSDEMLDRKNTRKKFRARPVPIESRILLYDKILEDQAMRRAISKINSEAELRAQMKPFSFVKRDERGEGGDAARAAVCERAANVLPKPKGKKRFRARPVPKNLFSNYVYDKIKDQEFYRSLNRRIRAEEMLRFSALPGTMGTRDRSRLSTPAAHSDLPTDPSPPAPSATPSDRQRARSPMKESKKNRRNSREDFITTTPQPFRFSTADRAAKKMEEVTKRMCEVKDRVADSERPETDRAYSALELRIPASGRSNLAALLRVENVRRRFEMEAARRLAEQRRRVELRARDRLLRSNPVWHLVKNNHEEDIALRLQTRRDEERMRREEFLHEMELMYGRVQQQPFQFERYYAPRSHSAPIDLIQLSPRKSKKKNPKKILYKNYHFNTPMSSRKVSINDATEVYNGDIEGYLNKIENDEKLFPDSGSESSEER
ncbi:Protein FAM161A [Eumeta japonica]|uniref:Protein FAM161A n=1 Tax=Eumeta variegata TaxID=151549 RepID=A0A4C1SP94_EUMVA|nr:Protein FAM161A [Eumeta japonica]